MRLALALELPSARRRGRGRPSARRSSSSDAREVSALEVLGDLDHPSAGCYCYARLEPGFGEQLAQALEAGEHPALDRPERLAEPLGELGLREAAVVGELDRLALLGREPAERLLDDLALASAQRRLVSVAGPAGSGSASSGSARRRSSRRTRSTARRWTSVRIQVLAFARSARSGRRRARPRGTPPARRPRRAPRRGGSAARARRRRGRSGRRARPARPRRPRATSASSASSESCARSRAHGRLRATRCAVPAAGRAIGLLTAADTSGRFRPEEDRQRRRVRATARARA